MQARGGIFKAYMRRKSEIIEEIRYRCVPVVVCVGVGVSLPVFSCLCVFVHRGRL